MELEWKSRKADYEIPTEWSNELWTAIVGRVIPGDERSFSTTVFVASFEKKVEVSERSTATSFAFASWLPISFGPRKMRMNARVVFEKRDRDQAFGRIPANSVGWVHSTRFTSNSANLSIHMRADAAIEAELADMVWRARTLTEPDVPLHLWGNAASQSQDESSESFSVIQPLSGFSFQQFVRGG